MRTRSRIGGPLNLHALAQLSRPETAHRPDDHAQLAAAARDLAAQGLTHRDIATALRLHPGQVAGLLTINQENDPCEPSKP
jgi:hypothetical protein